MTKRDFNPALADLAETDLQRAAQLAGGNVNRTTSDRFGWDCCIEFDPIDSTLPPDLRPSGLMILAQVKSRRDGQRQCRLTLSNALKYAKHSLPYFLVLVGYGKGADKPAIYVKHVWGPLFEQILKAVRAAHDEGAALNKRHIVINFDEGERYDLDAVKFMAQTVDQFQGSYTVAKQAAVAAIGYDDVCAVGQFTVGPDVDLSTFIDATLGLVEGIDVQTFTLTDARFGLVGENRIVDGLPGRMSFVPRKVDDCVCTLRRDDTRDEISLEGEVFVPGIPNLPQELWKLLIRTPLIKLGLHVGGSTKRDFSASVDFEQRVPFDQLIASATMLAWLGRYPLTLQLWRDGHLDVQGRMDINADGTNEGWALLHEHMQLLASLAPASRIPKTLTWSMRQFIDEMETLAEFRGLLTGKELGFSFESDYDLRPEGATHMVCAYRIEVGDGCFLAIIERPIARIAYADNKVSLELGAPHLLHGAILRGRAEDHTAYLVAEMRHLPDRPGHKPMLIIPTEP